MDLNKKIEQILREEFLEQDVPNLEASSKKSIETPKLTNHIKPTVVQFNKGKEDQFRVKFSERGFAVEGTRLSFELLDIAISKNFNLTLEGGNGLELDHVKMQQILKYRDRF